MAIFDFLKRKRPEDEFAARVVERLRERGWPHEVSYDRKRFCIWLGPQAGALHLHNSYYDWLTYPPEERSSALDLVVAPALETDEELPPFEKVVERILPLVRNSCDYTLEARGMGSPPASKPLAGPLGVLLAIDQPTSIRILSEGDLAAWGETFEAVFGCAIENLESKSPCRFERDPGGFYASNFEDYYDASRLLLPRLFDQLELRGAPVAVAATRYCVVVAGSQDAAVLNAMAAYVEEELRDATRPISYAPLILENGGWSPFQPDGLGMAAVRALAAKQAIWDYGKQLEVLNEEPADRDLFIGVASSLWDDDELVTWATWAKDIPTLMPRVDYLGLTDGEFHMFRKWEEVEAVCGSFEVVAGHVPTRYFVHSGPNSEAFVRLKQEFQSPPWERDALPSGP